MNNGTTVEVATVQARKRITLNTFSAFVKRHEVNLMNEGHLFFRKTDSEQFSPMTAEVWGNMFRCGRDYQTYEDESFKGFRVVSRKSGELYTIVASK